MSTGLETAVAECLRPDADGKVDVEQLRAAAVRRAVRIRRRRLTVAAAGLAVVSAAAVAWAPGLTGEPGQRVGGPPAGRQVPTAGAGMRLPAADAPGAAQAPERVGAEPGTLHFDVDLSGLDATGTSWAVRDGVESLSVWTGVADHYTLWYDLTTDPGKFEAVQREPEQTVPLSVAGRPATARSYPGYHGADSTPWTLTWQPVDGLWVQMKQEVAAAEDLLAAAQALRLDRSQACVAPMLVAMPAGLTWTGCDIDFGHIFPWTVSGVSFVNADGAELSVSIGRIGAVGDDPFVPNVTALSRPGMLWRKGHTAFLVVPLSSEFNVLVHGRAPAGVAEVADAELVALAQAVTPGPNFTDPAAWPRSPVS
jgi:hypothetical protein